MDTGRPVGTRRAASAPAESAQRAPQRLDRVRAKARSIRWDAPAIAAGLVLVILVWQRDDLTGTTVALAVTRAVGVILVVGFLALLDDVAFSQVAAVPAPLYSRELPQLAAMTVLVLGPVLALAWAADLPWRGLALEIAALLALGAAMVLVLRTRTGHLEPSLSVSVVLLVLTGAFSAVPSRYQMWVQPGPEWSDAHRRWAALLVVSLAAGTYALRDPAARSLRRALLRSLRPTQGAQ